MLFGAVVGLLSGFLISSAIGGGSLILVGGSMIAFGIMFVAVGGAIKDKKVSVVTIIAVILALFIEGFFIYSEMQSNKERDVDLAIIESNLQLQLLESCGQNIAAELGKASDEVTVTDCPKLSKATSRDGCYECYAVAFKQMGKEEMKNAACANIKDELLRDLSLGCR